MCSTSGFHSGNRGLNPVRAVKFDIADLYVKVLSGSNRLFLCPLDVLSVLYCYQPVTNDLMSCCQVNGRIEGCVRSCVHVRVCACVHVRVCVCVHGSPVLVVLRPWQW